MGDLHQVESHKQKIARMNTRSKTHAKEVAPVAATSLGQAVDRAEQLVVSPTHRGDTQKELQTPSKSQNDAAVVKDEAGGDVEDITRHLHKISFGDAMGEVAAISTVKELKTALPAICNEVFAVLGQFNLEATYQRALAMELRARGVRVHSEVEIPILYKGQRIATRRLDLYLQLDAPVILELKAVTSKLSSAHLKQLEYYMAHFDVCEGYLINFPHVTGFPDDSGVVFEQEMLQPADGVGVSDRSTRSAKPRRGAQPEVVHVSRVGSAKRLNYTARLA